MSLPTHPILRAAVWLSVTLAASACSSADSRAQTALADYQSAAASNDMTGARKALLRLVQAKDDVAEYWVELGRVEATMGAYGDAYYAFTRAYELDRTNPDIVRVLTQFALRSGDLVTAQAKAQELEILAPGDPWIKLTKGWAAVGESRYDQAVAIADELLAQNRFDPGANALKGRALFGLNRVDDAVSFLAKHVDEAPSDSGSIELLAQIYERRDDWAKVADLRQRLSQIRPDDQANLLSLAEASFRSNDSSRGRAASLRLLRGQATPSLISKVLELWSSYWSSPQRIEDASILGRAAPREQRLVYARFLTRVGRSADAIKLAVNDAQFPVNANNAEANAVVGDALFRGGNVAEAERRLNAVIAFDPGNATALRARAELELRTGNAAAAIDDAQKLVTVLPNSAPDRLLLARAYTAAGDKASADRALWTAFNDIPGSYSVYVALRASRNGNAEALAELQGEFERQRDAQVHEGIL